MFYCWLLIKYVLLLKDFGILCPFWWIYIFLVKYLFPSVMDHLLWSWSFIALLVYIYIYIYICIYILYINRIYIYIYIYISQYIHNWNQYIQYIHWNQINRIKKCINCCPSPMCHRTSLNTNNKNSEIRGGISYLIRT